MPNNEERGGRIFSSANLVIMSIFITALCSYVYKIHDIINFYPMFFKIIFIIIVISFGIALYVKAPLFIEKKQPVAMDQVCENWQNVNKSLNWLATFSFAILTLEPSNFISFFSGISLRIFFDGKLCKFSWENKSVKFVHRFLDFILLLISIPSVFLLTNILLSFSLEFGILLFIISTILYFKKEIIYSFFSLNIQKVEGIKTNIIYPYSTLKSHYKLYGYTNVFSNTVFITEETFKSNFSIKEYILFHELGHLKSRKKLIIHKILFLIMLAYLTIVPFILDGFFVFLPLITYLIYNNVIGKAINEKIELSADEYALKKLGKETCLEALHLMEKKDINYNKSRNILFSNYVPLSRRIQFINDYNEEKI